METPQVNITVHVHSPLNNLKDVMMKQKKQPKIPDGNGKDMANQLLKKLSDLKPSTDHPGGV